MDFGCTRDDLPCFTFIYVLFSKFYIRNSTRSAVGNEYSHLPTFQLKTCIEVGLQAGLHIKNMQSLTSAFAKWDFKYGENFARLMGELSLNIFTRRLRARLVFIYSMKIVKSESRAYLATFALKKSR